MSYTTLLYHIVVRTKCSQRTISIDHERELYMYCFTFIKDHGCKVYRIGGMPDHLHFLVSMRSTLALADLMRGLKTATSKFMKAHRELFPMFDGWEKEYFAASVSPQQREAVRQYIIGQKEHHKHEDGRQELIRLCKENGIDLDERYL